MELCPTKRVVDCKGNNQKGKKTKHKMGKIFLNHLFEKELIYKIYRELLQHNRKKCSMKN
jgi:hypothetical protein